MHTSKEHLTEPAWLRSTAIRAGSSEDRASTVCERL